MKLMKSGPKVRLQSRGRSDDGKERQNLYKCARWRKLREEHLQKMPYCEQCLQETGAFVRSWIVDHIRGHTSPNWRMHFYDPGNLQTLCQEHHNKKTREERPLLTAKPRLTRSQRRNVHAYCTEATRPRREENLEGSGEADD